MTSDAVGGVVLSDGEFAHAKEATVCEGEHGIEIRVVNRLGALIRCDNAVEDVHGDGQLYFPSDGEELSCPFNHALDEVTFEDPPIEPPFHTVGFGRREVGLDSIPFELADATGTRGAYTHPSGDGVGGRRPWLDGVQAADLFVVSYGGVITPAG